VKLSQIKQILAEGDIRLTKSLGQNFLHDANQLRRIVDAAELKKSDRVLEIGPGLGSLTQLLNEQAAATDPGLRLMHTDALDYLKSNSRDWRNWKLVANLPYSVASPILVELAQSERSPQRIVVTLQIEVARRLMAKPGEKDYGILTLLVTLDYEPRRRFKIPASCFFPKPDVDSACVVLLRRPQTLRESNQREAFRTLVKQSFSQRRKMMLKLLKERWPFKTLERVFAQLELPSQIRAEDVPLEQFVRLAQILSADSSHE
jgi:16S rRNA (adenine1518-N6/adenine1519-N6)-dimethyltransferase